MYGGEKLNNHTILAYGLMKEFYETFKSLTYYGIPLPMTMYIGYQSIIQSYVIEHVERPISKIRSLYPIKSIKDPQTLLFTPPKCHRDLSHEKTRDKILLPAAFLPFALKKLSNKKVIISLSNSLDEKTLRNYQNLPSNFKVLDIRNLIKKANPPDITVTKINKLLNKIIHTKKHHPIFGSPLFKNRMKSMIMYSMKSLYAFERILLKNDVKVILGLDLLGSPGNLLSLLAAKYNLPYVWVQYWLLTDSSIFPSFASHYCVWGKNYEKWLVNRGIHENKIYTIGSLRFENEKRKTKLNREQIMDKLNIPRNHLLIILTTQNFTEPVSKKVIKEIMSWFQESIKQFPITIIVKTRSKDRSYYSKYLVKNKIILAPMSLELYELLENTDLLMTISSTTAIEAAIFNKGIIVLQPQIDYAYRKNYNGYHHHLAAASAGVVIKSKHHFYKTIKKLVHQNEYRLSIISQSQRFLNESLDQKQLPSDRLFSLIKHLL